MPKYIIEVKVNDKWEALHATGMPRYEFDTKEKAESTMWMCYPDQCRWGDRQGKECVRVRELSD